MTRTLNINDELVEAATKRRSSNPIISPTQQPEARLSTKRVKLAVYMDREEAARVRGCYAALPASQRPPSLSQWIASLIRAEVENIESAYSVEPLDTGKLKKGAPFTT